MKKILIHTKSLTGKAFEALLGVIEGNAKDAEFFVFCDWEKTTEAAGVSDEYKRVMKTLKSSGANVREIEEYSFDEYLFNNKNAEVYVTPVESASQIIVASAAILGFEGKLYIFAYSENQPPVINLSDDIKVFRMKKKAGLSHLDSTEVEYRYSPGGKCYFTVDGKDYCETIKDRSKVADSGVEGFTQVCESDNSLRLKIYDCLKKSKDKSPNAKKRYEIDRLCAMAKEAENRDIALPLAEVKDENGNVIGFVMRNICGAHELKIDSLRSDDNGFYYTRDILTQLLWLETRSILHRDLDHNFLVGSDGKAHIIDVDSAQYKVWPASARSMLPIGALPGCYAYESYFFNTIDISYTALCILISAIVDHKKIFGRRLENGFYKINEDSLRVLSVACPELASLFVDAHTIGKPVSVERLLEINEQILQNIRSSGKKKHHTSEQKRKAREKADEIAAKLKAQENAEVKEPDEENGDEKTYEEEAGCGYNEGDNKEPENDGTEENDYYSDEKSDDTGKENEHFRQESYSYETVENNVNFVEPPKDIRCSFIDFIRYEIILPMLMTGTVVFGESKKETYDRLMAEGRWKKLLCSVFLAAFVIGVLVAAILFL